MRVLVVSEGCLRSVLFSHPALLESFACVTSCIHSASPASDWGMSWCQSAGQSLLNRGKVVYLCWAVEFFICFPFSFKELTLLWTVLREASSYAQQKTSNSKHRSTQTVFLFSSSHKFNFFFFSGCRHAFQLEVVSWELRLSYWLSASTMYWDVSRLCSRAVAVPAPVVFWAPCWHSCTAQGTATDPWGGVGALRTSDVPCHPLGFLADFSSPLQPPAQLEWLELVAQGGNVLHSDLCPRHICCGHCTGSGSVSASTETFNSFYPHHFKGEATSNVMQWLSNEALREINKFYFLLTELSKYGICIISKP